MSDEREETVSKSGVNTTSDPESSRSVDERAESFLSLEAQFHTASGDHVRGQAVDVARVPASAVPEDFPVTIGTGEALALTVALDEDTEVRTYFEFEPGVADDRLSRLLAVHDISGDRFGDLHGEWLLLTDVDDHYLPVVPAEFPRGDGRAVYGIVAGLALNLLVGILAVSGLAPASLSILVLVLVVNIVGLPVATYVDAWHLRTRTDWGQGPAFWAMLAMVPGLNVLTVLVYLWTRSHTESLA